MNVQLVSGQTITGPPRTPKTPLEINNNHGWLVGFGKKKIDMKTKQNARLGSSHEKGDADDGECAKGFKGKILTRMYPSERCVFILFFPINSVLFVFANH